MSLTPTSMETVSGIIIDLMDVKQSQININDIAWSLSRIGRYGGHTITRLVYSVAQHSCVVAHYIEQALTDGTELNGVFRKFLEDRVMESAGPGDNATAENFKFWTDMQDMLSNMDDYKKNQYALQGLGHDCHEAYLTDIPTPVKSIPGVREALRPVEQALDAVIFPAMGIEHSLSRWPMNYKFGCMIVKWADALALQVEAYHMISSRGKVWELPMPPASIDLLRTFAEPLHSENAYAAFLTKWKRLKPAEKHY